MRGRCAEIDEHQVLLAAAVVVMAAFGGFEVGVGVGGDGAVAVVDDKVAATAASCGLHCCRV